jgi:PhnB protein
MTDTAPCIPALIPHIVCNGAAAAIAFYKEAFGAEELMRIPGQDGRLMHAAVSINDAMLMLVDEMKEMGALDPNSLGGTPVTLHLSVANADAAIERAAKAGATVTMPAQDTFWGDRYGQVKDPWGHSWSIAHPLGKVLSEDELKEAATNALCGQPAGAV